MTLFSRSARAAAAVLLAAVTGACKTDGAPQASPTSATASPQQETNPMRVVLTPGGKLGPKPVTYTARLPSGLRDALKSQAPAALLYVDGVQVEQRGQANFRIFVGLPTANAATPTSDPHFAGYVAAGAETFGSAGAKPQPVSNTFELAGALRGMAAGSEELAVTLVPVGSDDKEPAAFQVTHQAISVALAK